VRPFVCRSTVAAFLCVAITALPAVAAARPSAATTSEVAGSEVATWSNYSSASGSAGAMITAGQAVDVSCAVTGDVVSNGNPWWYLIASTPWNGNYYASADAFYNNGDSSGPLAGTPYVDPDVPLCSGSPGSVLALSPTAGTEDTVFQGTGTSFPAGTTASIAVEQPDGNAYGGSYTQSISVNNDGQFPWTWQWSSGDELGQYVLTATDGASTTRVEFSINADSAPPTPAKGSVLMFDTASAPSLADMVRWTTSPYRAVGVYVPVPAATDDRHDKVQKYLKPTWVAQVQRSRWAIIPIYFGVQAPGECISPIRWWTMSDTATTAYKQGLRAAYYAAGSVARLGISRRVPVIYDLEPYSAGCSAAVQAFVEGWSQGLHRAGRLAGVYGDEASAMTDVSARLGDTSYTEPDDVWIVTNNGQASTSNLGEPPTGAWTGHRVNQFNLDLDRTYGGLTIDIDESAVNDAVLRSQPPKRANDPPSVHLTARRLPKSHVRIEWSASTIAAPLRDFDIRVRTTRAAQATPWTYPSRLQATTRRSMTKRAPRRGKFCVSVRAQDYASNASPWTRPACITLTKGGVTDHLSPFLAY
jgi:Domain of unknown function (DUF1906)